MANKFEFGSRGFRYTVPQGSQKVVLLFCFSDPLVAWSLVCSCCVFSVVLCCSACLRCGGIGHWPQLYTLHYSFQQVTSTPLYYVRPYSTTMSFLFGASAKSKLKSITQDLRGKHYIVTGANTGLGYATARELTKMGAEVTLACRSAERGQQAVEKIKEEALEQPVKEVHMYVYMYEFCSFIFACRSGQIPWTFCFALRHAAV